MTDEDETLLIPRVTRRDRRLARRRSISWGWTAYSLAALLVIIGAAALALR